MTERQAPPVVAESAMGSTRSSGRTFGQWLRVQLKARRLTQRQLAQKSGVDHSTISRLVSGHRIPSLRTANLLAHGLGVTVGLDGLDRQGLGGTESPAARVEHALRLDGLLSEPQVRKIMQVYLATRLHRPGNAGGPASAPTTGATDGPIVLQVAEMRPRSTSPE